MDKGEEGCPGPTRDRTWAKCCMLGRNNIWWAHWTARKCCTKLACERIVCGRKLHSKTSVCHLWTNEISKLVLSVKLTGGLFLRRQYFATCKVLCF